MADESGRDDVGWGLGLDRLVPERGGDCGCQPPVILIGWLANPGLAGVLFTIAVPVYVTLSLRGAYRTGIVTSFLRMLVLSIFWLFAVSILSVGVVIASALSV